MEKIMRNAPSLAVLVVLIIQVTRVSEFGGRIGAGLLAPVFAVFLAGTIYVLSYWQGRTKYVVSADARDTAKHAQQMRMKRLYDDVHKTSGGWLILFVVIEGFLNLAETMANLPAGITVWEWAGALMYGAFPTLAAFGLGNLQALLDRVPHGVASKSALQSLFDTMIQRIETQYGADASQSAPTANKDASHDAKPPRNADAYPKLCPHGCGASLVNANAYTAHVGRWCPVVREKNAQNSQGIALPLGIVTEQSVSRARELLRSNSSELPEKDEK